MMMQTRFKPIVPAFAVPLLLCAACPPPIANPGSEALTENSAGTVPGDEETLTPTTGMSPGGADTTETGPGATDDTGDTEGPREPIANSVLATFVDEQGNKLPGAWVRVLETPDDPTPPPEPDPEPDPVPEGVRSMDPELVPDATNWLHDAVPGVRSMDPELPPARTADSDGNVLVEALGTGEQRWMIGAPGFVTRTEVFNLAAGTRSFNTFRLKHKGKTFAFDTQVAQSFEHENVRVELPAGHMINRRTGVQVIGPVSVTLTVVNPVAGNLDAPPAPLIGVDMNGGSGSLVSFGMVGVELTDADGERLELNEDVTAKVSFQLTAEQSAQVDLLGASIIPAWHADPDIGETEWQEAGVFFLSEKDDQGRYTATTHAVQRFSWINTDLKSDQPRCYLVKVLDQQNQPVIGQPVNIGGKVGFTDDGTVCIDFGLGSPPFNVIVPDQPPKLVNVEANAPLSVCALNNRPWYAQTPHGICTEIVFHVNNSPVCVPGSTWDCSDEPGKASDPALDGVGICKSAYRLCADGTGWGTCIDPVLPKQEVCGCPDVNDPNCDPNLEVDEDCDASVNEKENNNDCVCNPGIDYQYCYVGNQYDLNVANTACMQGLQWCAPNAEWGPCTSDVDKIDPDAEMVTPSLADEDCNPQDGVESCTDKPCDFDPLWWHSFGGVGKHVNLSSYLAGNFVTAVTHVTSDGDTSSHGTCFEGNNPLHKTNFWGVTLARYQTDGPDPNSQFCKGGNLIEGKLDTFTIRADSGSTGTAVSGLTTGAVAPDLFGKFNGCDKGIPAGTGFVTRFNSTSACQFRVVASAAVTMKDVSVGNTTGATYVGLTVPLNQAVNLTVGGVALPGCTFTKGAQRSAYVKLGLDNLNVTCSKVEYAGEVAQAIDLDSTGALSIVYRAGNQIKLRQLNGQTLALSWPTNPVDVNGTAIAGTLAVGANFEPYGIASFGQKIAVTGGFVGEMTSYGEKLTAGNQDFVLLVADNVHPQRGVTLWGHGFEDPNANPPKVDYGDWGTAVEWVHYIDPKTYDVTDGLVVAGNSFSEDFVFGPCWTDTNYYHNPLELDSFVGVFRYTSGMNFDTNACGDQHVLTGSGDQGISSLAVGDMRLGLCGHHTKDIIIGKGPPVQTYMGNDKNAQCGLTVLPIKPMQ